MQRKVSHPLLTVCLASVCYFRVQIVPDIHICLLNRLCHAYGLHGPSKRSLAQTRCHLDINVARSFSGLVVQNSFPSESLQTLELCLTASMALNRCPRVVFLVVV